MQKKQRSSFAPTAIMCVLLSLLCVMMFTGYWPTHHNAYNSYSRQACAWIDGQLDISGGEKLTWLELAIYEGKYYVSFPPFPSYVMLPFAAIFGLNTPDAWIALMVTCLGVAYACMLCKRLSRGESSLFWVLFLFLGTGYPFIAVNGWVWFIAQNLCFTLSLMTIFHALKGQGVVSLACWAAAVGCRPMVLIYLPLLLWILYRQQRKANPRLLAWQVVLRRWYWALPPLLLGGSYMLLNYLRFGCILEFGHNYLPEFQRAENGQFSLSYIWGNLCNLFRLPQWNGTEKALTFFKINGFAFFITNPMLITMLVALVYALIRKRLPRALTVLLPLLSLGYVLIICAHRTLGGWQFGNRYLLDIMPWMFFGFLHWKPRSPAFTHWNIPIALFAAVTNLMGSVILYNKWI